VYVLENWFEAQHAAARQECGGPEDWVDKTKPHSALAVLPAAVRRGSLPFRWLAAHEWYGASPAFRDGLAALAGKWHLTQIKDSPVLWQQRPAVYGPAWQGPGAHPTRLKLRYPQASPVPVKEALNLLPKAAWTRAAIQAGSQGPSVWDAAVRRGVEARRG
jgi:hypothetical protein